MLRNGQTSAAEGLPVGFKNMGNQRGETALLRAAKRFEQAVGISTQLPITPREIFKQMFKDFKRNYLATQFRLNACRKCWRQPEALNCHSLHQLPSSTKGHWPQLNIY